MKEELIKELQKRIVKDPRIMEAFKSVPREHFVLSSHRNQAYEDRPLPILSGQTISQPSTVLMMTQALEIKEGMKILEIGSGSGYQAALLGKLVGTKGTVVSTEILPELVQFAQKNLDKVGIKNVSVVLHDGSSGYPSERFFDRIIVTASASEIPGPLVKQLKVNGVMVIPVGSFYSQSMLQVRKTKNGKLMTKNLGQFIFVPLQGMHGRKDF